MTPREELGLLAERFAAYGTARPGQPFGFDMPSWMGPDPAGHVLTRLAQEPPYDWLARYAVYPHAFTAVELGMHTGADVVLYPAPDVVPLGVGERARVLLAPESVAVLSILASRVHQLLLTRGQWTMETVGAPTVLEAFLDHPKLAQDLLAVYTATGPDHTDGAAALDIALAAGWIP